MNERLARAVRARAGDACEYCLLSTELYRGAFEIEHIIARQHLGPTVLGNLAYACAHCNKHKGSNLASIDRVTSRTRLVRLFDPRRHSWPFHFRFNGPLITGRTPIGRVTVHVLLMNDPIQTRVRAQLIRERAWPPDLR